MVSMRITNDEIWKEIKSGSLKGLSIEGYFCDKMEKMSEKTPTDQEILSALNEMLNPNLENSEFRRLPVGPMYYRPN